VRSPHASLQTKPASNVVCFISCGKSLWDFFINLLPYVYGMLNVMVAGGEVSHDCFDLG
jgi:hypothetical protein